MIYEIGQFLGRTGSVGTMTTALRDYFLRNEGGGRLFGVFIGEIGELNKIYSLRGFPDMASFTAERDRVVALRDPFGIGKYLHHFDLAAHQKFDFLPDVASFFAAGASEAKLGPLYEIRTYSFQTGGQPIWTESLRDRIAERVKLSPLLGAFYRLDGRPGFTHFWPYESFEKRMEIRRAAVASGGWPPLKVDIAIDHMESNIALPADFSPLK
ncbi:MAG: NIPSNAP family protein [Alphaproteobacteria bacterium]|nr:NIPSNAP family protein [Alphaproteobacteria bacterium]